MREGGKREGRREGRREGGGREGAKKEEGRREGGKEEERMIEAERKVKEARCGHCKSHYFVVFTLLKLIRQLNSTK